MTIWIGFEIKIIARFFFLYPISKQFRKKWLCNAMPENRELIGSGLPPLLLCWFLLLCLSTSPHSTRLPTISEICSRHDQYESWFEGTACNMYTNKTTNKEMINWILPNRKPVIDFLGSNLLIGIGYVQFLERAILLVCKQSWGKGVSWKQIVFLSNNDVTSLTRLPEIIDR